MYNGPFTLTERDLGGGEGQHLVFNLSKVAMYEVEVIQTDYVETIKFPGSINTFIS